MRTGFKAQEADSLWKNYLPELVPFETSLARITRYISKVCQCSPLALTLIASFIKKISKDNNDKSIEQQLLLAFVALQRNCSNSFSTSNYQYTSVIEVNACPLLLYNVTRSAWLDISVHKSVRGRIKTKMSKNFNHEEIQLLGVGG